MNDPFQSVAFTKWILTNLTLSARVQNTLDMFNALIVYPLPLIVIVLFTLTPLVIVSKSKSYVKLRSRFKTPFSGVANTRDSKSSNSPHV